MKHWMSVHESDRTPPPFSFKITGQFKDCLSRQIMEAIKIQYSRDNILNSKCEYLQNCITRLVVNEEDWEKKERERREEEIEREEAKKLEEFKKEKMAIHPEPSGQSERKRKRNNPETNPVHCSRNLSQGKMKLKPSTLAQGVATSTMPGPSLAVMGVGARHPNNKPNTRSPPEQEVQEQFGSGLATTDAKRAVPRKTSHKQPKKKNPKTDQYNLAWFSLWWLRMERDGLKESGMAVMKDKMQGFLAKGCSKTGPTLNHLMTTPAKRKASIVMDEPCPTQNCESPAKRRRNKFNTLVKFWNGRGEGESEKKSSQILHTTTNLENIHAKNYDTRGDQDLDFSESNPKMSDNLNVGGRPSSDRRRSFGV